MSRGLNWTTNGRVRAARAHSAIAVAGGGLLAAALACSRADLPFPTSPSAGRSDVTHVAPDSLDVPPPSATPEIAAPVDGPPARRTPTPDPPHPLAATRQAVDEYLVQAGDSLGTIAERFGLTLDELLAANQIANPDSLDVGQVLLIPIAQPRPVGPAFKLIPDSALVYGPTAIGFDVRSTVETHAGYLTDYAEDLDGETLTGAEIVELVALRYSINPRLLLAVLEFQSSWLTQINPGGSGLYPIGRVEAGREGLYKQLAWAANSLNAGYYGWRAAAYSAWDFPDGGIVAIAPTLNAGTAGVQHLFSELYGEGEWKRIVSEGGFAATYERLFGYPFDGLYEPFLPARLTQPNLQLPFEPRKEWVFTGGPHGGWDSGSAWAALDFAPPAELEGCTPSEEWAVASAPGLVVRSDRGAVVQDLDGDGLEQTGWTLLYMHIEARGRVPTGARLQAGDLIGHPSCEGGFANGTHVHLARRYNGEWIPAEGPTPFVLDGWVPAGLGREYDGTLSKGDITIEACDCRAEGNTISR